MHRHPPWHLPWRWCPVHRYLAWYRYPPLRPVPGPGIRTRPPSRITPDSAPRCPGPAVRTLRRSRPSAAATVVCLGPQTTTDDRRGRRVPEGAAVKRRLPARVARHTKSCPMVTKAFLAPPGRPGAETGRARTNTYPRPGPHGRSPDRPAPRPAATRPTRPGTPPGVAPPRRGARHDHKLTPVRSDPLAPAACSRPPPAVPGRSLSRTLRYGLWTAVTREVQESTAGPAFVAPDAPGGRPTRPEVPTRRGNTAELRPEAHITRGQRDHPYALRRRSTVPEPVTPLLAEYRLRMTGQGDVAARRR